MMKEQLKKMFGESLPNIEKCTIKTEDTFHSQHTHESYYGEETYQSESSDDDEYHHDTYLTYHPQRSRRTNYHRPKDFRKHQNNSSQQRSQPHSHYNYKNQTKKHFMSNQKGKNPRDKDGTITRCSICESINHWVPNCPDNQGHNNMYYNEIVLYQTDYDHPSTFLSLVDESRNAAVLDSGASKTVCGESWFNTFQESLNDNDKDQISFSKSKSQYRFGDGAEVTVVTAATIPIVIGTTKTKMNVDIVPSNIPILLSRDSMKRANMQLNFENDTITAFGQSVNLIVTKSGHYAVPITNSKRMINEIHNPNQHVTLTVTQNKSMRDIAIKLHKQFAHPTSNKLIKLIDSAGEKWKNNTELKTEIKTITNECNTCQIFKKPPTRPVVGLPVASKFLECVAMDLKFYKKYILLHLIDHATHLSASAVIPSKKPETIIKKIFQIWISVYGLPEKFLSDNGGEFANQEFVNMCEATNINFKLTSAESPCSNGLVERHNLVLADMLDKILEETTSSIEIALAWAINAKNSLSNFHGFSPYQLAIGQNPTLPCAITDEPPALTHLPANEIIEQNLKSIHKAREAFIQSENSERIRRALNHNIRTYSDTKYLLGDSAYIKRANEKRWRGPGKVLGQDGQLVLIKYGSNHVRVHPCRITLDQNVTIPLKDTITNDNDNFEQQTFNKLNPTNPPIHSDSDSDYTAHNEENLSNTLTDNSHNNPQNIPTAHDDTTVQDIPSPTPTTDQLSTQHLRKNQKVKFKYHHDDNWQSATLIKRRGKKTGKYPNSWNVQYPDNSINSIDFDRDIHIWKLDNQTTDNNNSDISDTIKKGCLSAHPTSQQIDLTKYLLLTLTNHQ